MKTVGPQILVVSCLREPLVHEVYYVHRCLVRRLSRFDPFNISVRKVGLVIEGERREQKPFQLHTIPVALVSWHNLFPSLTSTPPKQSTLTYSQALAET